MTIGYLICLIASVGLLVAYTLLMKKREFWLTMLHVCVIIVNLGYFLTSIAKNIEFAIFGNDVAYLGSTFLCMCMLLTIIRLCGFEVNKKHIIACLSLDMVRIFITKLCHREQNKEKRQHRQRRFAVGTADWCEYS